MSKLALKRRFSGRLIHKNGVQVVDGSNPSNPIRSSRHPAALPKCLRNRATLTLCNIVNVCFHLHSLEAARKSSKLMC